MDHSEFKIRLYYIMVPKPGQLQIEALKKNQYNNLFKKNQLDKEATMLLQLHEVVVAERTGIP